MIERFGLGRKHVHLRFVRRFKQIMFFQLACFTAKTGREGLSYVVSWQNLHELRNEKYYGQVLPSDHVVFFCDLFRG